MKLRRWVQKFKFYYHWLNNVIDMFLVCFHSGKRKFSAVRKSSTIFRLRSSARWSALKLTELKTLKRRSWNICKIRWRISSKSWNIGKDIFRQPKRSYENSAARRRVAKSSWSLHELSSTSNFFPTTIISCSKRKDSIGVDCRSSYIHCYFVRTILQTHNIHRPSRI